MQRGNRSLAIFCLILLSWMVLGCAPEQLMQSRLAKTLESNGYTLYTPFRTSDYPASTFVLAKNQNGKITEFTVSKYNETFSVPESQLFDSNGQEVQWFDQLKDSFKFNADIGIELASLMIKPDVATKYAREIEITFGNPKIQHTITLMHLGELAPNLSTNLKNTLRDLKSQDQLKNVYLVLETVRVKGIKIDVHLKSEFTGKLDVEKLKSIANANVAVGTEHEGTVSLTSDIPLIIGYKAIAFPETILRTQIGVPDVSTSRIIPATEFTNMKR